MPLENNFLYHMITQADLKEPFKTNFLEFIDCFLKICFTKGISSEHATQTVLSLYESVTAQLSSPYPFQSVHIPKEEDAALYELGLELARPLIHGEPELIHPHNLLAVKELLDKGENVIFAANHQTELEPQILSIACDPLVKDLFKNTFFVAGERVTTDPIAAPFSRGRRLFCIYAKRYVSEDKEIEMKRRLHNLSAIKQMKEILNNGGACIYVALGGGRDRPDQNGDVQLTPFDPSSVGLFTLLSQTAKKPTHIFPLAISSFNILPPPLSIQKELGERRWTQGGDLRVAIGERFDFTPFLAIEDKDRMLKEITEHLFSKLVQLYKPFKGDVAPTKISR